MGGEAHVVVIGHGAPAALLDRAERRVAQLEARWSRFRDSSEVRALDDAGGEPVVVSTDTALLVDRCIAGWRASGGRFDPTVRDAMVANGYDRDRAEGLTRATPAADAEPGRGLAGATADPEHGFVWLPRGTHIDPGAIGKGLAADLVATELVAAGADGACVGLGGDVRVVGRPPSGDSWVVGVEDPWEPGVEWTSVALSDGGVATSSTLRRRWRRGGDEVHHVVDPMTGRPTDGPLVAVTAFAPECWRAEVAATHALVGGAPDALPGARLLTFRGDGGHTTPPELEEVRA
jgi:thiamine biosynthesis lipoprotein